MSSEKNKQSISKKCAALYIILSGISIAIFLGLIAALISKFVGGGNPKPFMQILFRTAFFNYILFGAPSILVAFFMLFTNVKHEFGYSMALYYGSLIIGGFLNKYFDIRSYVAVILAFIFISLIIYISWLQEYKRKKDEEERAKQYSKMYSDKINNKCSK